MPRLSRRERERRTRNVLFGTLLLLVVAGVVIGVTVWLSRAKAPLVAETMCPAEGAKGHYVLLIDMTDPLTFTQKEAFATILRDLVERRTPEGYLLSVFALDESFEENAKPVVELCNPGRGEGKSDFTTNIQRLQRQYEERFLGPILAQSEKLVSTQPAEASPIFEMLQLVAINGFRKHAVAGEKRLFLMSDMLHNTPQFSMYRGSSDFKAFSELDYAKRAQADLRGVEIEVYYLMNTPRLQTRRNLAFWEEFATSSGARIVAVTPVEG